MDMQKLQKKSRTSWETFIAEYLLHRESLLTTFVLIDARLEPQKIDLEFMNWCGEKGIPFSIIFTKTDKLSSSALQKNIAFYKKHMLKQWEELPPVFITSSESKFGRESLLNYLQDILSSFRDSRA
jgi:GTP-binding protein